MQLHTASFWHGRRRQLYCLLTCLFKFDYSHTNSTKPKPPLALCCCTCRLRSIYPKGTAISCNEIPFTGICIFPGIVVQVYKIFTGCFYIDGPCSRTVLRCPFFNICFVLPFAKLFHPARFTFSAVVCN